MIIEYNKEGVVDLANPLWLYDEYSNKIIKFLEELTGEKIIINNIKEIDRFAFANKTEKHAKRWTAEELFLLLDTKIDENILIKKLGRINIETFNKVRKEFLNLI